jgi:hypothetical protein
MQSDIGNSGALQSAIRVTGRLHIERFDKDGNLVEVRDVSNLVVDTGLTLIADAMSDRTSVLPTHMAVGSGSTAPDHADTTLEAELGRVALTNTVHTGGAVWTYTATFGAGVGTGALAEAGIFNASPAGDMLCRTTYPVINKGASDALTLVWTLTEAAS